MTFDPLQHISRNASYDEAAADMRPDISTQILQSLAAAYHWRREAALSMGVGLKMDTAISEVRHVDGQLNFETIFLEPGAEPPPGHVWTVYHTSASSKDLRK